MKGDPSTSGPHHIDLSHSIHLLYASHMARDRAGGAGERRNGPPSGPDPGIIHRAAQNLPHPDGSLISRQGHDHARQCLSLDGACGSIPGRLHRKPTWRRDPSPLSAPSLEAAVPLSRSRGPSNGHDRRHQRCSPSTSGDLPAPPSLKEKGLPRSMAPSVRPQAIVGPHPPAWIVMATRTPSCRPGSLRDGNPNRQPGLDRTL